jgi:acetyl esterase/lipase
MTSHILKMGFLQAGLLFACGTYLAARQVPHTADSSAASTASHAEPAASVSLQQDVEYGIQGGEKLLLDIYQPGEPSSKPRLAIVLIHGGGWTSFDKGTMRGMGNFLTRSGFVAVSVDYRLLQGTDDRWPAQLDDVQRAVRWLRANGTKYNIDASHIGAFGHSAGAQLAALLGMEDTRDNSDLTLAKYSSRVQAVVDVSGPSNFLTSHDADGEAMLGNLFGGDSTKLADVWRNASPVFHVDRSDAPFLIIHGTRDQEVPIAQSQELYDKLHQAGVPVSLVTVDDVHTFQTPEARRRLALESLMFFRRYLDSNAVGN